MPSFLEAIKGVYNGSVDILFLNEVLRVNQARISITSCFPSTHCIS